MKQHSKESYENIVTSETVRDNPGHAQVLNADAQLDALTACANNSVT